MSSRGSSTMTSTRPTLTCSPATWATTCSCASSPWSSKRCGNTIRTLFIVGRRPIIIIILWLVSPQLPSPPVAVCDPVLGDNGHLYVPESFVGIYRDELLPLAHISTPNQFEAELLSGVKIEDEASAWRALDWFHAKGVHTVVLSSTNIGSPTHLKAFLSCKSSPGKEQCRRSIVMPKLGDCNFTGTGDLFAALFFAHYTLETEAATALEKTVNTVQSVIGNTIKDFDLATATTTATVAAAKTPPTAFQRELKIVRSKRDIECPTITIKCDESY